MSTPTSGASRTVQVAVVLSSICLLAGCVWFTQSRTTSATTTPGTSAPVPAPDASHALMTSSKSGPAINQTVVAPASPDQAPNVDPPPPPPPGKMLPGSKALPGPIFEIKKGPLPPQPKQP